MKLSIMGVYNHDETIFDGLRVPVDKETVIKKICLDCAELEILYPDTEFLKMAISVWSDSEQYKWNTLYNTTILDYNPIWNVDANIEDKETATSKNTGSENRDITVAGTGQDKETRNMTDVSTDKVQGFNSDSWVNSHQNTTNMTGTDTHDLKNNSHTDDDLTLNTTNNLDRTYTQRRTGNIGVTATQQLIEMERKVAEFNLIEKIVESFKIRFCIMVY